MTIPFILSVLLRLIIAIVAIAFYTLIERKFLGYFQLRKGPNKVGLIGIPQPFADAIKLFTKEQVKPTIYNRIPFLIAPIIGLFLALIIWTIYPHDKQSFFILLGVLYFLCVSRMGVYRIFLAGWASNSKYALLGALRGVAQTISYEVRISLILLRALILLISLDFIYININIKSWLIVIFPPLIIIIIITILAETNRTPFDFAEGESELVSGFNVEYRRGLFAIIFIAEYTNILAIRIFIAVIIIGNSIMLINLTTLIKIIIFATLFIWVRATYPRIRYDNLINLTWKRFLPISLTLLILLTPLSLIINII